MTGAIRSEGPYTQPSKEWKNKALNGIEKDEMTRAASSSGDALKKEVEAETHHEEKFFFLQDFFRGREFRPERPWENRKGREDSKRRRNEREESRANECMDAWIDGWMSECMDR